MPYQLVKKDKYSHKKSYYFILSRLFVSFSQMFCQKEFENNAPVYDISKCLRPVRNLMKANSIIETTFGGANETIHSVYLPFDGSPGRRYCAALRMASFGCSIYRYGVSAL